MRPTYGGLFFGITYSSFHDWVTVEKWLPSARFDIFSSCPTRRMGEIRRRLTCERPGQLRTDKNQVYQAFYLGLTYLTCVKAVFKNQYFSYMVVSIIMVRARRLNRTREKLERQEETYSLEAKYGG